MILWLQNGFFKGGWDVKVRRLKQVELGFDLFKDSSILM